MSDESIVAALSDQKPPKGSTTHSSGKVEQLFGDRPAVLEAIVAAKRDQRLSYAHIAGTLTKMLQQEPETADAYVSRSAVQTYLNKKGL